MAHDTLSLAEIHALAKACLERHGCNTTNANSVAEVITAAERDGCHAHGLKRIAGYVAALESGKVNGHASPKIEQLAAAVVRVNGGGGFAPLALNRGRDALISATRSNGIAALSLINIHHYAVLWGEVESLAEAGLCALACVSYKPAVIPAGGSKALFGANPLAFAWPRKNQPPLVFDQASYVMARDEVTLAAKEGHQLAPGVGVDKNGQATTDPNEVLDGALLAFGGHKGSSIALMIELFAGALIGECFSFEAAERDNNDGGPPRGGELIIAMDPNRFGDSNGWADHAEQLFDQIKAQEGARLPSQKRYENREIHSKQGVEVSSALLKMIQEL